ncbi:putative signal transducing protein [Roseiconus lacunae]|uniref:putative signal transducing protein n=1 Tax=Roseiconus lacunae TaxID=2605694 RepID=UPI0011F10CE4|nr:DUF2007 domain-containing protein [Roseiconus lacunae]
MSTQNQFCVLREFGDQWSAVAIQSLLSAANISSHLVGTDPSTALSMGGAPTDSLIRVRVAEEDLPRAQALLRAHDEEKQHQSAWQCERCDEPNEPTFEYCWNCDAERSQIPARQPTVGVNNNEELAPFSTSERSGSPILHSANPYEATDLTGLANPVINREETEESVANYQYAMRRLILASICTLIIFPPLLSVLCLYLLATLPPRPQSIPVPFYRLAFVWGMMALSIGLGIMIRFGFLPGY